MKCRFCKKQGKHWLYKICPDCLETKEAKIFISKRKERNKK